MKNLLHSNKAYDDLIFASANVYLFFIYSRPSMSINSFLTLKAFLAVFL
ncbi:hypothetical protein L1275_002974 [Flavobacterium sp. HSC-61S13]|nr:hypothetical protein [Flavobacterium sp. HSC-61S13]